MSSSIASLVKRANAGEVNARDELARIGHGESPGYSIAQRARAMASRFGAAVAPLIAFTPAAWPAHPEDAKPELPPGALAGLKDPKTFAQAVLKCRQYRDGSWACAIVIASGAPINAALVQRMASAMGMSQSEARCFDHAVRHCDEASCRKLAAGVGPSERSAIAIGQCVGRARALQAARTNVRMAGVHNVIGWEMGEP